jgi:hypothetical protein
VTRIDELALVALDRRMVLNAARLSAGSFIVTK